MSRIMLPGRLFSLSALLFCAHLSWAAVTVSNVAVVQREGTKIVDITYDVAADVATVTVSVVVQDGGTDIGATSFSGDVGRISTGTGKHIEWDAGADWNGNVATLTYTITADDTPPSEFVLIPAGTNSGTDPDFGAYSLTVDAFYVGRYEVTKEIWDEVRAWAVNHGYTDLPKGGHKGANHPLYNVNWYNVVKWCNARSEKEGRTPCYTVFEEVYRTGLCGNVSCNFSASGYRLLTDTEWEYAARGGLSGKRFPWGNAITHDRANYNSNASYSYDVSLTRGYHPTYDDGVYPYTNPVGAFAANEYGLYDMAGNLCEWCWDWSPGYNGSRRLVRGGAWNYSAKDCRAGNLGNSGPAGGVSHIGFRICFAAPDR